MQKNKKKYKIITIITTLAIIAISLATNIPNAKAEELSKTIITGNVYACIGEGDFFPLISDNNSIRLEVYNNDEFIDFSYINDKGQYYLELLGYKGEYTYTFNINDYKTNMKYMYLFNTATKDKPLGALRKDKTNYINAYFRYFPIQSDISKNIYNYVYNEITLNSDKTNPVYNTKINMPGNLQSYAQRMEMTFNIKLTTSFNNYPAIWININDTNSTFLAGIGLLAVYGGSTNQHPWEYWIKDNVSGRQIPIGTSNDSTLSNFSVKLKYKTVIIDDITHIQLYYTTNENNFCEWNFLFDIPSKTEKPIGTINLQGNQANGKLTNFSMNFPLQQTLSQGYTEIYTKGYEDGKKIGFENGKIIGYNEGLNTEPYTFTNLISAVIDVPVNTFFSIFDVEILGVNMKTFVISIACIFIVVAIIKLYMGHFGNG